MKASNNPTVIISGFSGIGKTFLAEKYCNVLDLESSPFFWDYSSTNFDCDIEKIKGTGGRKRNLKYPQNFIDEIKSNMTKYDYILVWAHADEAVPHYNNHNIILDAYLIPSLEALEEYFDRYRQRGNTEEYLKVVLDRYNFQFERRHEISKNIVILEKGETLESYLLENQEKYPNLIPRIKK